MSASKEDVHNAIKKVDKGLFPQAFCKIIPDYLGNDPEYCNIMHAGARTTEAYMLQILFVATQMLKSYVNSYGNDWFL